MSPTDTLLDALAAPPPKPSTFREWLAAQPKPRQAALAAAATDDRWTTNALLMVLRDAGATCSRDSIKAWRTSLGFAG